MAEGWPPARMAWPVPGDRLPTLTEVVDLVPAAPATPVAQAAPTDDLVHPPAPDGAPAEAAAAPQAPLPAPVAEPVAVRMPPPTELTAEVLFELEQRIDSLFEARLREALAPALARAADGLIREARAELSGTLRAMVEEAVTRAIERHTHL